MGKGEEKTAVVREGSEKRRGEGGRMESLAFGKVKEGNLRDTR